MARALEVVFFALANAIMAKRLILNRGNFRKLLIFWETVRKVRIQCTGRDAWTRPAFWSCCTPLSMQRPISKVCRKPSPLENEWPQKRQDITCELKSSKWPKNAQIFLIICFFRGSQFRWWTFSRKLIDLCQRVPLVKQEQNRVNLQYLNLLVKCSLFYSRRLLTSENFRKISKSLWLELLQVSAAIATRLTSKGCTKSCVGYLGSGRKLFPIDVKCPRLA